jgi:hypothetical protein
VIPPFIIPSATISAALEMFSPSFSSIICVIRLIYQNEKGERKMTLEFFEECKRITQIIEENEGEKFLM